MKLGTRPLTWGADSLDPRSKGCTSKVRYTQTQARTAASTMARATGIPAHTYKCIYARHWHVTTKPKEDRIMSDETTAEGAEAKVAIAEPEPFTHEIDWDRVGTPRDIVAVLKAIGLNMRMTAEQARRKGIERFVREIKP